MASSAIGIDFRLTECGDMDIVVFQGMTIRFTMTIKDDGDLVDITGWSVVMQFREFAESEEVVAEMSTDNGDVTVGGVNGVITFLKDAANSEDMPASVGVYSIKMFDSDGVAMLAQSGQYSIVRDVSRG